MRRALSTVLLVSVFATPAFAQEQKADTISTDPEAKAIYDALRNPAKFREGYVLQKFYQNRGYAPVWVEEDGDWERSPEAFAKAIEQATAEGLNPNDYPLQQIISNHKGSDDAAVNARSELAVSDVIAAYIDDLQNGKVDASKVFPKFFVPEEEEDDIAWHMEKALENGNAEEAFRAQVPQSKEYERLRKALADYRKISEDGGWEPIAEGGVIKPGHVDERIPAIRERLRLLGRLEGEGGMSWFNAFQSRIGFGGDEQPKEGEETAEVKLTDAQKKQAEEHPDWVYDDKMEPAIREFQQRRGAEVDGVIGPETLAELNTPIEDRINQIVMSMEQWRWLPQNLGDNYVFVNTAGYYAKGVKNGRVIVETPVIVGKVEHPTPSFSSYITDVKFYPDWTVPDSIAKRYLLDKIQNNPAVVDSLGYELYNEAGVPVPLNGGTISQLTDAHFPPYRFRQKPGTDNALGLVRFSVENDYAIYLHDTPKDSLFEETNRNFSSGCVRVGEPVKMAQFLLAGNSPLSEREVASKFDVAKGADLDTEIVKLEQKMPVHLMYMTAWVDEEGNIRFESDAYGRDAELKAAMGL